MDHSRTIRVWFLGSMLGSMAVVLVWAGMLGWREWTRWRAVQELRAAVEANEPARFLDAVEAVDSLGVAEAAADEIAPLRHHAEPRASKPLAFKQTNFTSFLVECCSSG